MKRHQNLLMIVAVIVLMAAPLWRIQKPAPGLDGATTEIFRGTDDQARDTIIKLAPGYQPWFKSVRETPSGEISSLLFALQAALGAGFIGYYLGVARTRSKLEKAINTAPKC